MKFNLKEVTFIMPVRIDTIDREKNLFLILRYLNKYFETNIIVMEMLDQSGKKQLGYLEEQGLCTVIIHPYIEYFHKSYLLNQVFKEVKTPFTCIYDTDVILSPKKYMESLNLLKDKKAEIVVGFDGYILEVPKELQREFRNTKDILSLERITQEVRSDVTKVKTFRGINEVITRTISGVAVGGCVMFSSEVFKKIGMMNENMKSLGGQDDELILRAETLGIKIIRLEDPIFHLTHERPPESSWACKGTPQWRASNLKELRKVGTMPKQQLQEYINTWEWKSD